MLNLNKCMINNFLKETKEKSFILKQTLLYMKVFIFIFLASLQFVSANTSAQTISFNVNNVKLEDVFKTIASQSHYKFLYNDEVLNKVSKVSLHVKDEPLETVLSKLLSKDLFEYKLVSNTILVSVIANANTSTKNLQTRASGIVVDDQGNPLASVSITVVGTSTSSMTDKDGKFQIPANVGNTIEARYLGYKSTRLSITNLNNIKITLSTVESSIEEVQVVATGYQNIDRKLFTGAAAKVSAKDAERPGIPDVSRMLEGQVAGVSVQNVSGTFGAAPKIRVRGATSLSGDNKPLWVVDGIILEDNVNISNEALSTGDANTLIGSSVAGINPDDIESFTILKDAAATAMYGARAMNGVIVITTKKGRNTDGKPLFNYSNTLTSYLKPNYDQFDIMNSAEQMSIMIELKNKGYFNHSSASRASTGGIFYKMYNKMYEYDEVTETYALNNTLDDQLKFLTRYAQANTDWFDILFKNSLLQEHSLSVSSGTSRSQTYFSSSFTHDSGQTMGDNVRRYTGNLRNTVKLNDKLTAEFLVNTSIRDQKAPGTMTRMSDPVYGSYSRDFDINPYSYALNTSRLITPYDENGDLEYFVRNYGAFNILNELDNNYLTLGMIDVKLQAGIKYQITPQLMYSVDGAYRNARTERQHFIKENSNVIKSYQANQDHTIADQNRFLYKDPDNPNYPPIVLIPDGGFFNTTLNNLKNFYFRNNLNYNKKINDSHIMDVFGSFEIRQTDRQNSDYDGVGYQFENGGLVNPNYRYFKKMIEGGDPYFGMGYDYERFVAGMLRGAYAYKDRYAVNFTTRYDGSNLLGESKVARWLPTWNISGKWNIDQEKFFKDNNVISGASIRATYGLVASLGSARNSTAIFYNQVARRPYEDEKESLVAISSLENSELTWEKLYELNIGSDLSLFNNKIDVTVDWYKRKNFDLIGLIRTSGIGGQYTKLTNYADMESNGVEVTVAGNPIKIEDGFRWRTQLNFAHNTNKITRLDVNQNIWTLVRAEGAAVNGYSQRGLFSIQFDGLNPQYGYPTFIGLEGVKDTYVDTRSENIQYLKYHGPVDPTLSGGFFNQFSYKNISLSGLLTFSKGNFIRLQPDYNVQYTDLQTISKDMVNRWLTPGDESFTNIPSLLDPYVRNSLVLRSDGRTPVDAIYTYNNYNYSTERVANGDFIRLKQVALSYIIPAKFLSKLHFNSAQISLVGNNIALLYSDRKLNGADPEFFNNGGVAMPIPKQYTFSLKLGF